MYIRKVYNIAQYNVALINVILYKIHIGKMI